MYRAESAAALQPQGSSRRLAGSHSPRHSKPQPMVLSAPLPPPPLCLMNLPISCEDPSRPGTGKKPGDVPGRPARPQPLARQPTEGGYPPIWQRPPQGVKLPRPVRDKPDALPPPRTPGVFRRKAFRLRVAKAWYAGSQDESPMPFGSVSFHPEIYIFDPVSPMPFGSSSVKSRTTGRPFSHQCLSAPRGERVSHGERSRIVTNAFRRGAFRLPPGL